MSTKRLTAGVLAALMLAAVLAALLPAGGSARPSATFKAALISDVGHFNDKSFNQSQLAGLNLAKKKLKIQTLAIQSNNSSDYIPNLTSAIRQNSNLVIAAGFLMADALKTVAAQFPDTHFAITDDTVSAAAGDFKGADVHVQRANIRDLQVGPYMRRKVITGSPDMTAKQAAERMMSEQVGALPIVDSRGQIQGIVTRTDLIKTFA